MASSLFQGAPQTATSYTTSSTETPKWMQDAIYNQIQMAQNVANKPYEPYSAPTVAGLSPLQQKAYANVQANQGSWSPTMAAARSGMQDVAGVTTAGGLQTTQSGYLTPGSAQQNLAEGQAYYGRAGQQDIMSAANPYLRTASGTATENISNYMNPYTQNVTDQIAKLGARNLTENLLPGMSDQFIRSGQFGGTRMGEFGSRALRDTQESILNQQSQALQAGYGQALSASQADLARQLQLASTAGSLTGQTQQGLASLGQAQTNAGQAQQQAGLTSAQAAQQAQAADLARQQSALSSMASMAQQQQGMQAADVASLEGAGMAQQAQNQAQLNAAQTQYNNALNYPKQQLDWLSTQVRGMAPITPISETKAGTTMGATYSASPLSQLATGLYTYKGLNAPA